MLSRRGFPVTILLISNLSDDLTLNFNLMMKGSDCEKTCDQVCLELTYAWHNSSRGSPQGIPLPLCTMNWHWLALALNSQSKHLQFWVHFCLAQVVRERAHPLPHATVLCLCLFNFLRCLAVSVCIILLANLVIWKEVRRHEAWIKHISRGTRCLSKMNNKREVRNER